MSYIEKAIEIAVTHGYAVPSVNRFYTDGGETKKKKPAEIAYEAALRGMWQIICYDPAFWSALGKALGWKSSARVQWHDQMPEYEWEYQGAVAHKSWEYQMHRLIDHLASGGTSETFFEGLLAKDTV